MKKRLVTLIGALSLGVGSSLQAAPSGMGSNLGVAFGGGYLEELSAAYMFGQIRANVYEDAQFRHTIFGELLFHSEDADVELLFGDGSSGIFDGDMSFANFTLNYELGLKLSENFEFYAGGGAGVQLINLDINTYSYYGESLDSDSRFVSQAFAGIRGKFANGVGLRVGARRIFVEDFKILGDSFTTDDQWGFEAALTFEF